MLTISFTSLFCGVNLAYASGRLPRHADLMEQCGGYLLMGGLMLLGVLLQRMSMC